MGAFDASPSRVVQLFELIEQRLCRINKYQESGQVKFNLGHGTSHEGMYFGSC